MDLKNNCLKEISENLTNLESLQYLYLEENQITSLPQRLENMVRLRYLGLNGNPVNENPSKKDEELLKELEKRGITIIK